MTSKQVMLTTALCLLCGCAHWPWETKPADPLLSPYGSRKVWAVAPLRNESGSQQADGLTMADHLAHQLENASNISVLPVNRVLDAMKALQMSSLRTPADIQRLLAALDADYLVIGTITAYDPYDPPKVGLAIELFTSANLESQRSIDLQKLSSSSTDQYAKPPRANPLDPVSVVSTYLDAADPAVRPQLQRYATRRGQVDNEETWRLYRINMDLYCEFASYVMSWRLLAAERQRYTALPATSQPAS